MNFQQLRIIRETVRQNFNLTEVGNALFTSQSGVSKHIKDLEDELGVALFVRKGKRFLGLTEPGKELLTIVERMLIDAGNVKRLAEQFSQRDAGQLTIATTHTQARYALPRVVAAFREAFPRVHLVLHQASPDELVRLLLAGEADLGIATEAIADVPELVSFPYYSWHHSVVAPPSHPLHRTALTLDSLASYPIVTYHQGFTGRARIDRAFAEAGLTPDIVMAALDADVIKAYVELGLGVGIVASMAVDPTRDTALKVVEGPVLFGHQTARIAVRRGHYLRSFAYRFISLCSPALEEGVVRSALDPARV
ncbi:CysB family HTH-type transcriptional regulator [Gulbenkiania mobilis]|uniref:LysR family cys regulon transcriptional activator n=1 Tax=Gulbenkiania mobilis TaxID=397457 RepID=A0ABY2CX11_GULMO|nr:LysR family cys regulon transcriptional activator [Gulbenkiania mobilis]